MRIFDVFRRTPAPDRLQRIEASLTELHGKVERLMGSVNEVNDLVQQIDAATNDVAAKVEAQTAELQRLRDLVANGDGVTPADLDAIIANLQPISARLQAIGADAENPVPTV